MQNKNAVFWALSSEITRPSKNLPGIFRETFLEAKFEQLLFVKGSDRRASYEPTKENHRKNRVKNGPKMGHPGQKWAKNGVNNYGDFGAKYGIQVIKSWF